MSILTIPRTYDRRFWRIFRIRLHRPGQLKSEVFGSQDGQDDLGLSENVGLIFPLK